MSNPFDMLAASIGSAGAPPMPTNAIRADDAVPIPVPAKPPTVSGTLVKGRSNASTAKAEPPKHREPGPPPHLPTAPTPPPYPTVANPRSHPKFQYSRSFLLKVARQSKLIEKPPPNIMPELLRPLNEAGSVHAPPAAPGSIPRTATKLGVPAKREEARAPERERGGDRSERGGGRAGERESDRRWNDSRDDRRDERRDDRRGGDRDDRRPPRDGTYDSKGKFEATPSWANTEVKNTLDDDDTFGSGSDGEFVLGATLDRDADAKIMAKMGWGEMFRASADLEAKAAAEREEIRRQMQQEEEERDAGGSSDFNELPADHPLARAKMTNIDEVDLDKLDQLLAMKAAAAAKAAGRESQQAEETPEWANEPVAASAASVTSGAPPGWGGSAMKPMELPPKQATEESTAGGTSRFASRFGFGLQEENSSNPSPWGAPPATTGAAAPKSQWGFALEDSTPADQSVLAKFASTPNTIHPTKLPSHQTQHQHHATQPYGSAPSAQPQQAPEVSGIVYQKIEVSNLFSNFGSAPGALPSMPTPSSAPLPPAAAAAVVAEDPLQRLVSKHRNRKATPVQGQAAPPHMLAHQPPHQPQASAYPPGVSVAGVAARYDAPQTTQTTSASSAPASLLNNPTFLNLPPHQQQQYLRHWEQQQQQQQQMARAPPTQQQTHAQPAPSVPSHYVSVNRPGFPSGSHLQQQQQQAGQAMPPGQYAQLQQHHQQPQSQQSHTQSVPQQHQGLPPGMLRRPPMPSSQATTAHQGQTQQPTTHMQQQQGQQQPQPVMYQQPGQPQQTHIHGRMAPNQGVVPTMYSAPAQATNGSEDGLSRWFGHLSAQNLPQAPLPPSAQVYNPNQFAQQQLAGHQQRR